jgi:hypothetical protein
VYEKKERTKVGSEWWVVGCARRGIGGCEYTRGCGEKEGGTGTQSVEP